MRGFLGPSLEQQFESCPLLEDCDKATLKMMFEMKTLASFKKMCSNRGQAYSQCQACILDPTRFRKDMFFTNWKQRKNTKWEHFVKSRKCKAGLYLLNQVDTCGSLSSHHIQRGSLRNEVTHVSDVDAHFKGACKHIRRSISLVGKLAEFLLGSFPRVPAMFTGLGPEAWATVRTVSLACYFWLLWLVLLSLSSSYTRQIKRFFLWTNESVIFRNYSPSLKISYLWENPSLHLQKIGLVGNKLILSGYNKWVGSPNLQGTVSRSSAFYLLLLATALSQPYVWPAHLAPVPYLVLQASAVMLLNMHLVMSLLSSVFMPRHGLTSTYIGNLAAYLSHTVDAVAMTTFLLWMHPSYPITLPHSEACLASSFCYACAISQQDLQSATSLPKKGLQVRRGSSVLSLLVCLNTNCVSNDTYCDLSPERSSLPSIIFSLA